MARPIRCWAVIYALSLPHHDGPILGADLNRSESMGLKKNRLADTPPRAGRGMMEVVAEAEPPGCEPPGTRGVRIERPPRGTVLSARAR